jgi:hypothetical protein
MTGAWHTRDGCPAARAEGGVTMDHATTGEPHGGRDMTRTGNWREFAEKVGRLDLQNLDSLPDFLVVSPPRTGSTWLARNMAQHPELFVASAKEVKFFSNHWRTEDINWYAQHFMEGVGRKKGEVSPSYSILPSRTISFLRELMPALKLIFLMREPVERAWSHTKHSHRCREADFCADSPDIECVTDETFVRSFTHEWLLAHGDYLGMLERWLAVFPPSQMFIGFHESIRSDPRALLASIFGFLGVSQDLTVAQFPVAETVYAEQAFPLRPSLRGILAEIYRERTQELTRYLADRFGIAAPPAWHRATEAAAEPDGAGPRLAPSAFRGVMRDFVETLDDNHLDRILALDQSQVPARLVLEGYRGFNIVRYAGRYFALPQTLGSVNFDDLGRAGLGFLHRAASHETLEGASRLVDGLVADGPRFDTDRRLADDRRQAEHERARLAEQSVAATMQFAEERRTLEDAVRSARYEATAQALQHEREREMYQGDLEIRDAQIATLTREAETRSVQNRRLEALVAERDAALADGRAECDELREWIERVQEELVRAKQTSRWRIARTLRPAAR